MPLYDEIERFIRRRVRCLDEAADLTQEAYTRVLVAYGDREVDQPRPLLYRVARNLIVDRARQRRAVSPKQSTAIEPEPVDGSACPARTAEQRDQMAAVREAIAELPARCREAFILNRFGGMTYREVALRLRISPKTVEKHIARAIAVCRAALDDPAY